MNLKRRSLAIWVLAAALFAAQFAHADSASGKYARVQPEKYAIRILSCETNPTTCKPPG